MIGKLFNNLEIVNNVNQNGLGFGINISKKLINKLGGEIYIENNNNLLNCDSDRGVTVTIDFPLNINKRNDNNSL